MAGTFHVQSMKKISRREGIGKSFHFPLIEGRGEGGQVGVLIVLLVLNYQNLFYFILICVMLPQFFFSFLGNGLNMWNSDLIDNIRYLSYQELRLFDPSYPYSLFYFPLLYVTELQKYEALGFFLYIFSSSVCRKFCHQELCQVRLAMPTRHSHVPGLLLHVACLYKLNTFLRKQV